MVNLGKVQIGVFCAILATYYKDWNYFKTHKVSLTLLLFSQHVKWVRQFRFIEKMFSEELTSSALAGQFRKKYENFFPHAKQF